MKKLVIIITSAVLVLSAVLVYSLNRSSEEMPKKELSKVEVEKEVLETPVVERTEVLIEEPQAAPQVSARTIPEPVVEESRLSSDEIVQFFKQRAMTSQNPANTGYGLIVGVYLSGHQHGISQCFDKTFDLYSSKFTTSSIHSTMNSLDTLLLDEARAPEYNQLCLNPQNYL